MRIRDRQPELMDQPGLAAAEHRQALAGLRRVNRLTRSDAVLWRALRPFLPDSGGPPLRVLDVACGGGDLAVRLARRATAAGVPLAVVGCDVSETAVEHAGAQAAGAEVEFVRLDALRDNLPDCDVATCTLFLHHLDETDAVDLLRRMAAAARRGVLVSDLRRTRLGYAMAWAGTRLLSRSPIVHIDGPLSVRGAFTDAEALALAGRAGLAGATVARHWPQRFLLHWSRP